MEESDGYIAVQGEIKQDARVVVLGAQYLANNSPVTISNPQKKAVTNNSAKKAVKKIIKKAVSSKKSS